MELKKGEFDKLLSQIMRHSDMKQAAIAEAIGVTPSTLSRLRKADGMSRSAYEALVALAQRVSKEVPDKSSGTDISKDLAEMTMLQLLDAQDRINNELRGRIKKIQES